MSESCIDDETEWLLYNLWRKSETEKFPFSVPDTVIYKYGKPQTWYFTSKEGIIRRKNRKNLTLECVRDAFCAKGSIKSEMSATVYTFAELKDSLTVSFEHVPFCDIRQFTEKQSASSFILQKFVLPKAGQNSVIEVTWSPHIFRCEKFVNRNQLDNSKLPILDRVITIESNGSFSYKEILKSPSLVENIENSCRLIEKHISQVFEKPSLLHSLTLLFKQDTYDRLQLLFCSSVKIGASSGLKRICDSVPRYVRYKLTGGAVFCPMSDDGKESLTINTAQFNVREFKCTRCPMCLAQINTDELFEINNKTIVDMNEEAERSPKARNPLFESYFFKEQQNLQEGQEEGTKVVPKAIQNMYPGISYKGYVEKRNDSVWLFETARVCPSCWQKVKNFESAKADGKKTAADKGLSKTEYLSLKEGEGGSRLVMRPSSVLREDIIQRQIVQHEVSMKMRKLSVRSAQQNVVKKPPLMKNAGISRLPKLPTSHNQKQAIQTTSKGLRCGRRLSADRRQMSSETRNKRAKTIIRRGISMEVDPSSTETKAQKAAEDDALAKAKVCGPENSHDSVHGVKRVPCTRKLRPYSTLKEGEKSPRTPVDKTELLFRAYNAKIPMKKYYKPPVGKRRDAAEGKSGFYSFMMRCQEAAGHDKTGNTTSFNEKEKQAIAQNADLLIDMIKQIKQTAGGDKKSMWDIQSNCGGY